MKEKLLSVIVANYNYGRFLESALKSLLLQMNDEVEVIVVDGGSNDHSVDIIRSHADELSWWCSERDSGQSEAFNKGFAHATGRFLTWLNADDIMLPRVVETLRRQVDRYPSCEWFVGGSMWLDPNLNVMKCVRARAFSELRYKCGMVSAWGPSCFFSKRLLGLVGGVDERLHYMMDTDLWMKFARAGYRYRRLPCYAYGLRLHPDAKMSGHNFAGSAQSNPNHPKWKQLAIESSIVHHLIDEDRYTLWKRLLTMGWAAYFRSLVDTFLKKGRLPCEV